MNKGWHINKVIVIIIDDQLIKAGIQTRHYYDFLRDIEKLNLEARLL